MITYEQVNRYLIIKKETGSSIQKALEQHLNVKRLMLDDMKVTLENIDRSISISMDNGIYTLNNVKVDNVSAKEGVDKITLKNVVIKSVYWCPSSNIDIENSAIETLIINNYKKDDLCLLRPKLFQNQIGNIRTAITIAGKQDKVIKEVIPIYTETSIFRLKHIMVQKGIKNFASLETEYLDLFFDDDW